jgi:hypothetical protein
LISDCSFDAPAAAGTIKRCAIAHSGTDRPDAPVTVIQKAILAFAFICSRVTVFAVPAGPARLAEAETRSYASSAHASTPPLRKFANQISLAVIGYAIGTAGFPSGKPSANAQPLQTQARVPRSFNESPCVIRASHCGQDSTTTADMDVGPVM